MRHKVHLYILETATTEKIGCLLHHLLDSRMGRIDGISTVQFLRLAIGVEVDILEFIVRSVFDRPFGMFSPIGERRPVYTWNLAVGSTMIHEVFQLFFRETVPA